MAYTPLWSSGDTERRFTTNRLSAVDRDVSGVDLLIIGGGFSGLSAARHIKAARPEARIVVVEREYCGYGASGRNGGFLNASCVNHDPLQMVQDLGEEAATRVSAFAREAVAAVRTLVAEHSIDCDLEHTGLAFTAQTPAQLAHARKIHAAAVKIGLSAQLWDQPAVRKALGVPFFRGAYVDAGACHVQPFKLARGILTKAVLPLGVEVYENTAVERLDTSCVPVQAHVRNQVTGKVHVVRSAAVLVATNAYTTWRVFGKLAREMAPLHVYGVATEPLTPKQLATLGASTRTGWYTLHHILYAGRLTADNRLVIQTGNTRYHWGNALHVQDDATYEQLEASIRWFFPHLADCGPIRIASRWEGVIACNLADRPSIGVTGAHRNVFYSLAYNGHGVALANHSGTIVRDLFLGRHTAVTALPFVNTFTFPPIPVAEPFRKLIDLTYINMLRYADRVTNRHTTGGSRGVGAPPVMPLSNGTALWLCAACVAVAGWAWFPRLLVALACVVLALLVAFEVAHSRGR